MKEPALPADVEDHGVTEDDTNYFRRREQQELLLAAAAPDARSEAIHLDLAKLYAEALGTTLRRVATARHRGRSS